MAGKIFAVVLALVATFACGAAFAEVASYKGNLEAVKISGALCPQQEKLTLEVELVLKREAAAGPVSGFARATGGTVGRFGGESPSRLALSYPYFNSPYGEGNTLELALDGERLTGTLHAKSLEASLQGCQVDLGKLQLVRTATGNEAEKALAALSAAFDADFAESEARFYWGAGKPADAEPPLRRLLALREAAFGKDAPEVAVSLNYLGQLAMTMGRYAEAGPFFERALSIREAKLPPDHYDLAVSLNNLAWLYVTVGRYAEAEPLYKKALAIQEAKLGADRPETAATLHNMAWLYASMARYPEAEAFYKRALEIRETKLERDHPDTATTMDGLGELYVTMSRYTEAEPLLRNAVRIREAKLGKDHPRLAESLDNLAWLYQALGRYAEAEALYKKALEIGTARLGKDNPDLATTMNNLAELYMGTGRYAEAESFLRRSLELWESKYGKDHPELAATLDNLAWVCRSTGRYAEAEPLYKRAIAISESRLGKDHPDLSPTMNNLAELYITMGRTSEAEALLRRSMEIWEAKLGKDHPDMASSVANLASLYMASARYAEAETLFKRALGISEAKFGKEHPDMVPSLHNLAELYILARRYSEAEALLRRALPIAQSSGVPESLWTVQADFSLLNTGLGRREAAIFFGKQAVNTLQGLRRNVAKIDKATLQTYQGTIDFVYKHLSDLLIQDGRLAEAQQVLDLLKQEEYFDYVQRDAKDEDVLSGRATLTGREASLESGYREKAESLARLSVERGALYGREQRTAEEETRLARLDQDLEKAGAAFQKAIDEIDRELSETRQDKAEQIREAQGLQEDLRELGQGTVALYTLMGEDKYRLLLIAPDLRMAYEVPVPAKELNRKIQAFRNVLRNPAADPRPLAKELYTLLLAPAAADLKGLDAHTLMWSLDGALRYLPVAALHDGEHYLVETYRSVLFTPASQARLKDKPKSAWKVLGLGVSREHEGFQPLPAVREELEEIVKAADGSRGVLPGIVDLDEGFTLAAMKEGLRQRYPVVHIASHFQFTPGDDAKSYLLLGDGNFLTLKEVKTQSSLFGGVELLTLSACNTGVGDGKEVEGFGVLAQRQGAKGVIATLWPVADDSTGLLMQNFYRLREQDRLTKAEALQRVQQSFIQGRQQAKGRSGDRGLRVLAEPAKQQTDAPAFTPDPKAPYAHPYYWAPFILIGNWQ